MSELKNLDRKVEQFIKYNATYLAGCYEQVIMQSKKYALFIMNIKNFRYFNIKYGYKKGDEILALVFSIIKETLDEDEYIAHLYADSFAFMIHYESIDALLYTRMMDLIDKLYRIEEAAIHRNLFVSYGVYLVENNNRTFEEALDLANLSRKECETLHNRSTSIEVYDENFYRQYINRLELEINTAEAYKNYEFIAFLQPKVDLKTTEIVGAEALLRWFDKEGNMIPLDMFLPILNQNGYIQLVDIDIFEESCKVLDKRIKENKKVVPISFNISKSYFYNDDIVEDYIKVFEKYEIPKSLIEIELMESISLDDTKRMNLIVKKFKEYGFACLLDDFGNGYSSFNVLLNAHLDVIKMDRQFFLHNLNGDNELVIKTIVQLIHSLNMKVVAEGVEKEEHIACLKACGCDYVQGYYYYKPMPVKSFYDLL